MSKITVITDIHIGFTPEKIKSFKKFLKTLSSDYLIICGDIATSNLKEIELAFEAIHNENLKRDNQFKTLCVFGNHDFWDGNRLFKSLRDVTQEHKRLCGKYNVHHLENNKYESEEFIIYGFDGWYQLSNPPSNDKNWMSLEYIGELSPFHYLQRKEQKAVGYILDDIENSNKTKIVVTHFNYRSDPGYSGMSGNERIGEMLIEKADYYFFGHTHQPFSENINGCEVLNVGADYKDMPSSKTGKYYFELKL
jgi:predicted phosphodiesterase